MTHLKFNELPVARKTKLIQILSNHDGFLLGQISWDGGWRQYVFLPNEGCRWSHDCLDEVAAKIRSLMEERRLLRAKGK